MHTGTSCHSSNTMTGECRRGALGTSEFHDMAQCASPCRVRDVAPDWVLANAALAKAYTIYQPKTTVKMPARGAGAAPTTNWS